jgi:nicotinate-nucleotide adenylyltransferase
MQDPALRSALKLPHAAPGQRIGLFGGTFDPPHKGHLTVSLMALRRLELDAVWWLVTISAGGSRRRAPWPTTRRFMSPRSRRR